MEGLTAAEVRDLDPPVLFIKVGGDTHSVNPRDGEPLEDVWQRARQFRDLLFDEYEGSRVLVIAHGVFLQMLHGVLRGLTCIESLADYPGTLELHSFCFEGRVLLVEDVRRLAGSAGAAF
jgi:broad specificity phosphatase PhoE